MRLKAIIIPVADGGTIRVEETEEKTFLRLTILSRGEDLGDRNTSVWLTKEEWEDLVHARWDLQVKVVEEEKEEKTESRIEQAVQALTVNLSKEA